MDSQAFPGNLCFYPKVIDGYHLVSFPWWLVLEFSSFKGSLSGQSFARQAEAVLAGYRMQEFMNSTGSPGRKEEIPLGCSSLEAAPCRQLLGWEMEFPRLLKHIGPHGQDTDGFLHFLSIFGFIISF